MDLNFEWDIVVRTECGENIRIISCRKAISSER